MEKYNVFSHLSLDIQQRLTDLCDEMYEPDDGTLLQELAARAFILGRGNEDEE